MYNILKATGTGFRNLLRIMDEKSHAATALGLWSVGVSQAVRKGRTACETTGERFHGHGKKFGRCERHVPRAREVSG